MICMITVIGIHIYIIYIYIYIYICSDTNFDIQLTYMVNNKSR